MGKGMDFFFFVFFCIGTGVILQDSCAFLHTGPKAHKLFGSRNSEDNAIEVDGLKLFPESLTRHDPNRWSKTSDDGHVELCSWGADLDNANELKFKPDAGHGHKEPDRTNNQDIPESQLLLVSSLLPALFNLFATGADDFPPPMDNTFQTSSFSIIALPEIQEDVPTHEHSFHSEPTYTTHYPTCPRCSQTAKPEASIAPTTRPPPTFSPASSSSCLCSYSSSSSSSSPSSSSSSSSSSSESSSESSTSSSESSFSGLKLDNFSSIRKLLRKLKNTEISVQLDDKDNDTSTPSREFQHRIKRRKISVSI